jgi:hypothetical protein
MLIALASTFAHAQTVWNGPPITFSKPGSADPTQPANQDRITANVRITRGGTQGIYNAKSESLFTHDFSPADTEWADGSAAAHASLTFTDWNTWAKVVHAGPPTTVGVPAVVHLITDDIYIDISFTSWAVGGDFSYQRATATAAANSPPMVTITNPSSSATLSAPASLVLRATASDTDGTVTNVQFFQGAVSLGNATASPYSVTVNSLAAGDYTFSAIATDNGGLTATNQITAHVVNPIAVTVGGGSVQRPSSTSFQFSYSANVGLNYFIQRSLDLRNWTGVLTNVATNTTMIFRDDGASGSGGFYRVGRVPNP